MTSWIDDYVDDTPYWDTGIRHGGREKGYEVAEKKLQDLCVDYEVPMTGQINISVGENKVTWYTKSGTLKWSANGEDHKIKSDSVDHIVKQICMIIKDNR